LAKSRQHESQRLASSQQVAAHDGFKALFSQALSKRFRLSTAAFCQGWDRVALALHQACDVGMRLAVPAKQEAHSSRDTATQEWRL